MLTLKLLSIITSKHKTQKVPFFFIKFCVRWCDTWTDFLTV